MTRVPLILSAYVSLFALGLGDNVRGPVFMEILETFGVSNSLGAWMWASSSLAGAFGARMSVFWLARFSRVKALNLTLAMAGLGLFVMASAPTFALLLVGATMTGYGWGLMGVLQNSIVSTACTDDDRSRVLSGLHAMYGLASFLAPLLVVGSVALVGGGASTWRWALAGAGALTWAGLALNHFRFRAREHGSIHHPHRFQAATSASSPPLGVSLWMAVALASYVVAEILVSSRLAQYFRLENAASLERSSYVLTGFFVALLAGRLISSAVPVRDARAGLMSCLAATIALLVLGMTVAPLALALSGLAMGPVYPLCVAFLGKEFGEGIDAIMSWVLTAQGAFLALMHLGAGWLTDGMGIRAAFVIGPLALGVSFLMIGLYGPLFRRHAARI